MAIKQITPPITPDVPKDPSGVLWWHKHRGYWTKKINGLTPSFGSDLDTARVEYNAYLKRVGGERDTGDNGALVKDVVNAFLTAQLDRVGTDLAQGTFVEYRRACERFGRIVGPTRRCSTLGPADFAAARLKVLKKAKANKRRNAHGGRAVHKFVNAIRFMADWAFQNERIPAPFRFGSDFQKMGDEFLRKQRNKRADEHGKALFSPDQLRAQIAAAGPVLKAAIMGGLHCLGNADIADLSETMIDRKRLILDFPRAKNGLPRVIAIRAEFLAALDEARKLRPKPKRKIYAKRFFLADNGLPLVRDKVSHDANDVLLSIARIDRLNDLYRALLADLKQEKIGVGFNTLRATARTMAVGGGEYEARELMMGHRFPGVNEYYIRAVEHDLLRPVTDHIWNKIFTSQTPQLSQAATAGDVGDGGRGSTSAKKKRQAVPSSG